MVGGGEQEVSFPQAPKITCEGYGMWSVRSVLHQIRLGVTRLFQRPTLAYLERRFHERGQPSTSNCTATATLASRRNLPSPLDLFLCGREGEQG